MENLNVELLDSSRSSCLSALDMFDALSMDIESSQIEIRKLKEIVEKFPTASVRKNKEENSKTSDKKLKRVEDALLERKEKTERKLARLREEKLRKEMESCKAKPSINKKSKRMVGKDRVSLSERSKRYVEDRDKRTQKLREQLEQEKQTEFKPKINQKSRTMHRSVSEMMAWKEKAELKKEANRMIAKVEEEKALRRNMKPQINKRSERLARRRARKNDEVGSTVGDRLNLAAKKRRERMERKRQEEQKRAMAQRRPKLSKRSANYKRREDGHRNAADRLYFSAQRTDMKKQYVKEREDYLKTPSFVPKINKKSRLMAEGKLRASASRGAARLAVARGNDEDDDDEYVVSSTRSSRKTKKVRVEDRLAKKAEEYEQRRKRRVENLEKKANEMSRKVATNRRSEFLAGDREISSTLHRPIGNVRPSTISDMSKDCTFSPALLSRSKKKKKKKKKKLDDDDEEEEDDQYSKKLVASSSFSTTKSDNVSKVFERNQKWLEKRQLKHQQKLSEKLKSSAEKCTFRPRINQSSKIKTTSSIAERSREWLQAKQEKQQKKRSEKENEALRECTFRPNRIGGNGGLATTVVKSRKKLTRDSNNNNDDDEGEWNYYETDDGYVYSHNPKTGETRWAEEHEVKFHETHGSISPGRNSNGDSSIEPESLDRAFRRVVNT